MASPPGSWPPSLFANHRIISGHIPYSNIERDAPEALYLTLLRHPVKQVISHYWQIRRPAEQSNEISVKNKSQLIDSAKEMTVSGTVGQEEQAGSLCLIAVSVSGHYYSLSTEKTRLGLHQTGLTHFKKN